MRLLKHILFLKSLKLLPKQHKVRYILITRVVCILKYLLEKRKIFILIQCKCVRT